MDGDPLLWYVIFQLITVIIVALLSAVRGALTAVNETTLDKDDFDSERSYDRIMKLIADREPVMALLVNFSRFITCLSAVLMISGIGREIAAQISAVSGNSGAGMPVFVIGCILLTLIYSFILTIIGYRVPQRLGKAYPLDALKLGQRVASTVIVLMTPFEKAGRSVSQRILSAFHVDQTDENADVTEDEIRMMVDIGEESGAIESDEKEMIENVFELNNTVASEIMTPRTDVEFIHIDDDEEDIVATIIQSGHSRFPVYNDNLDDIMGILNVRDYLLNQRLQKPKALYQLLREPYFVPETARADDVFRDMQQKKVHIGIVVDEYGGTSGLLTMEDLLEQIVGNIYDEFDPLEEEEIRRIGENEWRIMGTASLDDVQEAMGFELPEDEDSDTFGGFVFSHMDTIPDDGQTPVINLYGLHIRVMRIMERRLDYALVSFIKQPEAAAAEP